MHQVIDQYLLPSISELVAMKTKAYHFLKEQGNLALQMGQYTSKKRGRGLDFDQVRAYQYGDDSRHIHWRAMARSGHVYTKLFTEERERPVWIVVDYRSSMQFGTRKTFKAVVAARVAAQLAWAGARRKDRIGGLVFDEYRQRRLKPLGREQGVLALLQELCQPHWALPPNSPSTVGLAEVLSTLKTLPAGAMIVIISDFQDLGGSMMENLDTPVQNHLIQLGRYHTIVNVRIEDPLEKCPPPEGLYRFFNRAQYLQLALSHTSRHYGFWHQKITQRLSELKRQQGFSFFSVSTEDA